ncbi:MAG TPA: DUF3410 domain-containing protein, partial [Fibrobacteria bacterium]|nr:DUF3410 domain-containing protein [Fibrobacteria bacterium]
VEGKVGGTFQVAEAFRSFFSLPAPSLPPWPAPADPLLPYPADPAAAPSDAAFLEACVRRAYDITADDARLREALREPDPGKAFDRLRKEYPVRHEFKAYRVAGLPARKRELRVRLQGLGFALG